MGQTNLRYGLERKFSSLAGELEVLQLEISKIEKLNAALPEMKARSQELENLLNCTDTLLKSINPAWEREKAKPLKPNVHKSPVRLGQTTKLALDVLREANQPMTSREIALEVLKIEGIHDVDASTRQRVTNSVDATLRAKLGVYVESDGAWLQRWNVLRSS